MIDPLGHTEEYNQYTYMNLGNNDAHYRLTQQQEDSGKNSRSSTYTSNGTTGTTVVSDSLGSAHNTTYTWDPLLQSVLTVQGPLCNCQGNQLAFSYDTFGRLHTRWTSPIFDRTA